MRVLVLSDLRVAWGADTSAIDGVGAMLRALLAADSRPLRVVLNGDTFDFPGQRSTSLATPVAVARALLDAPAGALLVSALREPLTAGGRLVVRAGEHDGELREPAVAAQLLAALADVEGARIHIHDATPSPLDVGGVRVAICRRAPVSDPATIRWIAARILAPLRTHFGLGLADHLRPDYIAAVLAALAVNPASVKLALAGHLGDGAGVLPELLAGGGASPLDLPRELVAAGLDERERVILLRLLDPAVAMGDVEDVASLERARLRLFRGALARLPSPTPTPRRLVGEEWHQLRTIARRCGAAVIVSASGSRCGWRSEPTLTAIDTGSWTWQVLRPEVDEPARWRGALATWQRVAASQPTLGAAAAVSCRLTAALVEPSTPAPGARVALIEWRPGVGVVALRERSVVA